MFRFSVLFSPEYILICQTWFHNTMSGMFHPKKHDIQFDVDIGIYLCRGTIKALKVGD